MPEIKFDMPEKMYDYLMMTSVYYQKDYEELVSELLTSFFNQDGSDIEGLAYIIAGRGYKAWKKECQDIHDQQDKAFDEEIRMYGIGKKKDEKEYKKDRFERYWKENKKTIKEDFYRNFTRFLKSRYLRTCIIEDIVDKTKNMILWEGRNTL